MSDQRQHAAATLEAALRTIMVERRDQHGDAEDSFQTIALFWSAYLGHPVSAFDVAEMMVLLKVARAKHGDKTHGDHFVDQAGYAGLAAMLGTLERLRKYDPDLPEKSSDYAMKPGYDYVHDYGPAPMPEGVNPFLNEVPGTIASGSAAEFQRALAAEKAAQQHFAQKLNIPTPVNQGYGGIKYNTHADDLARSHDAGYKAGYEQALKRTGRV